MQRIRGGQTPLKVQQGSMTLLVLVICFLLVAALSLVQLVAASLAPVQENIRMRQLTALATSTLKCELEKESKGPLSNRCLPAVVLYPGKTTVSVQTFIKQDAQAGLRLLSVHAVDTEKYHLTLQQLKVDFCEQIRSLAKTSAILVGGRVEGGGETLDPKLYTSIHGADFPEFNVDNLKNWAVNVSLPVPAEVQKQGFCKRLYVVEKDIYALPEQTTLVGETFLVFKHPVTIGKNSLYTDRLILFANSQLTIGDNVTLDRVLIICKGRLRIGSNCTLRGVVIAKNDVILGDNLTLIHDPGATAPFDSVIYRL